jgi:coenzyme F420-reducing hydrogenase delta subunit
MFPSGGITRASLVSAQRELVQGLHVQDCAYWRGNSISEEAMRTIAAVFIATALGLLPATSAKAEVVYIPGILWYAA